MVAVIGAGNWGKNLVRNFHQLGALDAVVEVNPELREQVSREYPDVAIYDDCRAIWHSSIAAVAIATPATTHFRLAREAILAGKDVFVEKPFVLAVDEGEQIVDLAQRHGRVLMVGHLLLYQPAIQWIKGYLQSGKLGRVHSFHQERLNLGKARAFENALWSLGVHDIAVLLHLVDDEPNGMQVSGQRVLNPNVEDDVTLHITFPRGVQAHLHTSWLWPEKRRRLTVVGSRGMLVYDEIAQQVVLHRKKIDEKLTNCDDGTEVVFEGGTQPLQKELQHFLDRVEDRGTPMSDGSSSVSVIRVLERASQELARTASGIRTGQKQISQAG